MSFTFPCCPSPFHSVPSLPTPSLNYPHSLARFSICPACSSPPLPSLIVLSQALPVPSCLQMHAVPQCPSVRCPLSQTPLSSWSSIHGCSALPSFMSYMTTVTVPLRSSSLSSPSLDPPSLYLGVPLSSSSPNSPAPWASWGQVHLSVTSLPGAGNRAAHSLPKKTRYP